MNNILLFCVILQRVCYYIIMRKIVSLFIVAMMPVVVFGQDYEPFLKESKIWKYLYENPAGTSYMYSRVVSGDTIINGLAYKKIYDVGSGDYQYALREDGKKVYCKFQNNELSQLLYDFGKNTGEIISEKEDKLFKSIINRIKWLDIFVFNLYCCFLHGL